LSEANHTLADAVRYFTGKTDVGLRGGRWPLLWDRLEHCPHSAYEFCYFVVHRDGDKPAWHKLLWQNFMTADSVWEDFLASKQRKLENIRLWVGQQNRALRCYLKNGFDAYELLHNGWLDMNALVRVENALRLVDDKGRLDSGALQALLSKYIPAAVELAVGVPEFLHFTPFFRRWASQQEGKQWMALQWQIQRIETMRTR